MRTVVTKASEIIGDRTIVLRSMRKHFFRQRETGGICNVAILTFHFVEHAAIIGWIANDHNILVILCGRTQHCGTANVDILNCIFQRALILCHRLLERIQIHHYHVDGRDRVFFQHCHMFWKITPRQNPAMHFWMQRFHAAIEHFRKARVIGHFRHVQSIVGQ